MRKPPLQIFMLMWEDAHVVLVSFGEPLPFILNAREDTAIVFDVL